MGREGKSRRKSNVSSAFKVGAISLAFLIIGYQIALFVHNAAFEMVEAGRDRPDTVYVVERFVPAPLPKPERSVVRKNSVHSEVVSKMRARTRKVESFRFNPNTVSVEDLQRLGFSEKQALSIEAYRSKGGRFRRPSDFAKSFVVSDSIYDRLEKFIDIPLLDINAADSAAFDALPGIGGWFASRMVKHREELGGYSCPEQLMDIYHFDEEKFNALKDLICCTPPKDSFDLWRLAPDSLRKHPYIRSWQTAKSVVFYREHNEKALWTVQGLVSAGILSEETGRKLERCLIKKP